MIADWPNILLFKVSSYRKLSAYLHGRNNNPAIPVFFFGVVFVKETAPTYIDT